MTNPFCTRPKASATELPSKIPLPTTPTTTIPSPARSKTKTTLRLSQVTMNRTPLSFCLLPSPPPSPPSPPPSPSSLSSSCIRKIMPGFLKKDGVAGSHDDLVVPLKRGIYTGDKLEKGWVRVRRFPVAPHLIEAGDFEVVGDEEKLMEERVWGEDEGWVLVD